MLENKPKPCKGINKAYGFEGCGKEYLNRKFGLCPSCMWDWMQTTAEGELYRLKQFGPKVEKVSRVRRKEKRKRLKVDLMSVNQYRKTYVQGYFNNIIRSLDAGYGCIANPGRHVKHYDAGHFYSIGSNLTLALNAHNVHKQSVESNQHKGGQPLEFYDGLVHRYGEEYAQWVKHLKQCPPLKFNKERLKEVKSILHKFEKELRETESYLFTKEKSIQKRNELNQMLGLYPQEFSVYEGKIVSK